MTDLEALHHFLGISVTRSSDGLLLSQRQYSMLLSFSNVLACPSGVSSYHDACGLSPSSPLQMVPQSSTRLSTVASPGRYKTLLSPAPTWPMRSSRCASSCMTPRSRTLSLSNAFSTTSRALFLLVYTSLVKCILHYVKGTLSTGLHIGTGPLRTGQGASTPFAPHRATASTSATPWCLGRPSVRPLSLALVLKQSTVPSPVPSSSAAGCTSFSLRPREGRPR